jgi:hypothetical protein
MFVPIILRLYFVFIHIKFDQNAPKAKSQHINIPQQYQAHFSVTIHLLTNKLECLYQLMRQLGTIP